MAITIRSTPDLHGDAAINFTKKVEAKAKEKINFSKQAKKAKAILAKAKKS